MTAQEAIEDFTWDCDHELNNRDIPLLAKAFNEIHGSVEIPEPFKKWLIALGCPDYGPGMLDVAKVTSLLFAGLLERARIKLSGEPDCIRGMFREAVTFAEPVAEQICLMRQTIAEIEEVLAQAAALNIAAAWWNESPHN
jgi:hypothetical protein